MFTLFKNLNKFLAFDVNLLRLSYLKLARITDIS